MIQSDDKSSPFNAFRTTRRKMVRLSAEGLVGTDYLDSDLQFPLVMRPIAESLDLPQWAGNNRAELEGALGKHGAILFRGFKLRSAAEFERFVGAVSGEALTYNERSSP